MLYNLFIGILFLAAVNAPADERLKLEDADALAQVNNPELRVLESSVAAAQSQMTVAKTWMNPELGIAPGFKREKADGSDETTFHLEAELIQPVKFPGKRAVLKAIAEGNIELQNIALSAFRRALSANVRREYAKLMAARQVANLRHEQVESAKLFADAAKQRSNSGYASDFEVARSEAELISARKALRAAETEIIAARVGLNTLMGRKPMDDLQIAGKLIAKAPPVELSACEEAAQKLSPILMLAARRAEVAGLEVRAAKLERRPDFAVGPSLEYTETEQVIGLGISLPIPIWDGNRGPIAAASAEHQKALAELEAARSEAARAVAEAAERYTASRESAELYTPAFLETLKSAMTQAEHGLANNATTLLIYLDAKQTYFDTLSEYYETFSTIAETRADLESAMGCSLEELSNRGGK